MGGFVMLEIKTEQDINIIKPLWEALNRYQAIHSKHFSKHYRNLEFEDEMRCLNGHNDCRLEVIYQNKKPLGFILGKVDQSIGEIDSLYIYDDLRGQGLGTYITNRMLLWFETKGVKKIELNVSSGSEELIHFYKKVGFHIRRYTMEIVGEEL